MTALTQRISALGLVMGAAVACQRTASPTAERQGSTPIATEDSSIAAIRRRVAEIERELPRYRYLERKVADRSTEGGILIAYGVEGVSRGGPRKIVVRLYGEMGRGTLIYFYADVTPDSLIFAEEWREQYDRPLSGKTVSRERAQYVFSERRLLQWSRSNGQTVPAKSDSALIARDRVLRESAEFFQLALHPDSAA